MTKRFSEMTAFDPGRTLTVALIATTAALSRLVTRRADAQCYRMADIDTSTA